MIQKDPADHSRTQSGTIVICAFWSIAIEWFVLS